MDGEWEDIPDLGLTRHESDLSQTSTRRSKRSPTPSTPQTTARRRKPVKTVFIAAQPPTAIPRRLPLKPRKEPDPLVEVDGDQMRTAVKYGLASSVRYFGAVVTDALRLLGMRCLADGGLGVCESQADVDLIIDKAKQEWDKNAGIFQHVYAITARKPL